MVAALALLLVGALQRFEAVEAHMGTLVRITVYASDAETARRGFAVAFARIHEIDERLSDYKAASELSRACLGASDSWTAASPDLLQVLTASLALSESTGGAFDMTVGRMTKAWRAGRLPDASEMAASGFRHVRVKDDRVSCGAAGMELDAGGIAKGYAGDEALRALSSRGITHALVAVSGDMVASAAPPGSRGWRVRIPGSDAIYLLAQGAVSTSGDKNQFRVIDGIRHSHIIDPRSGKPLTGGPTVTVVARRGIDADSYATALCVMGTTDGLAWIGNRQGIAARFVEQGVVHESSQFSALLPR